MTTNSRARRSLGGLFALIVLCIGGGCATTPGYQLVKPTLLDQAAQEVPENELLDVGVVVTSAPELTESQLKKQGTQAEIRKCESYYIPYHLKNTLQMSSYWGSVQVVPSKEDDADVLITSELVKSNGETMLLKVEVTDSTGRLWFRRNYQTNVKESYYQGTVQGEQEAFQDLYNTIANDVAAYQRTLTYDELDNIRTVSKLKFAQEFAPDAYGDYLVEDGGTLVVQRLPSDDDPHMARIEKIRERDAMFVDTLNQYYEGFYGNMWNAYHDWRMYYQVEQTALRQAQKEAVLRTIGGIMMIAAAVALQVGDVPNTGVASGILLLGGSQVVISGINVSEQAKIHADAIEELSLSFSSDMRPTVIEFEGKQYELTGTAEEQYQRWKSLLQQIYYQETGFEPEEERFASDDFAPAPAPVSP